MLPLLAIVGRPNVGKSTLFNRLTRSRKALVDDTPGLTRDRLYGMGQWNHLAFRVVDTGGFQSDTGEPMSELIREQALVALEEADGVIFVTDARAGVAADDWQIADLLRRSGKRVVLAVNKAETKGAQATAESEMSELGLHPLIPISAQHGDGVGELLALLLDDEDAPEESAHVPIDDLIQVALVGCPNVGKSSLVNRLLGESRQIVSEIPGTTRDSVEMPILEREGRRFQLIDTAGIRRKSRISLRVEKYSVLAALRAVDQAQVAVLVLDAERGITDQDKRVGSFAADAGCGLVFAVNKWDTVKGGREMLKAFQQQVEIDFPRHTHAPLLYVSARTGQGVDGIFPTAARVWDEAGKRISTGALNRWLRETVTRHGPPRTGDNRTVKLRYATQVEVRPPSFLFFCNHPDAVGDGYRRYLENQLRIAFGFAGSPIRLFLRKGENPYS